MCWKIPDKLFTAIQQPLKQRAERLLTGLVTKQIQELKTKYYKQDSHLYLNTGKVINT